LQHGTAHRRSAPQHCSGSASHRNQARKPATAR
jgi:hypothetical protein